MKYTHRVLAEIIEQTQNHTAMDFMRGLYQKEPLLAHTITEFMKEITNDLPIEKQDRIKAGVGAIIEILFSINEDPIPVKREEVIRCIHCQEKMTMEEAAIHGRFEDLEKIGEAMTVDDWNKLTYIRDLYQKGKEIYRCGLCATPYTDKKVLQLCLVKNATNPILICGACYADMPEQVERFL